MRAKTNTFSELFRSSFYSCEKDSETILRRLFLESEPYSTELKKLLVINTKDCLDNSNQNYNVIAQNTSINDLIEGQYITLDPRIQLGEHEEMKSYIVLSYDHFTPTSNPHYRDHTIHFDILCPTQEWNIGDLRQRPLKIAGIIDGLLNEARLSGIGTLKFSGMTELLINNDLAGYSLSFKATNGNDDKLPENVNDR